MSVFVEAATLLLQPEGLLFIAIGVIIGILGGAIPGFSASNAVAVSLPFSLIMTPEVALMFLAGIYVGASYGGCLPAIMINAPGTPGAAATALDGYPMSQKGEAQKAIGVSVFASAIGGFLGAALLVLLMQPIGQVALEFGQAEVFVMGMFGLTALAIVLGDDVKKGLVAGFGGLVLAAITADPTTAQPRMTFGLTILRDQVPFIPIIIGLFAISEIMYLIRREKISSGNVDITFRGILSGVKYVVMRPVQILRAMLIGVSVGTIPGAGPAISNFISWSIAKSSSDNPEDYGEGEPSGVMASEASDNATVAGTLIPTLALGIPGSGTAAVIMGALILHGIIPGPRFMTNYMTESVAIMMGIAVANLFVLLFGLLISKYILRVILIPTKILVPAIVVFTAFGAFALRNAVFDIWFMLLFGLIGFIMREKNYPIIPMVLAVILGPIVESAFRRSMLISQGDPLVFFSSRITIALWVLMVLTFVAPTLIRKFQPLDRL